MFKKLCRWLLQLKGWKVVNVVPEKNGPDDIHKYVRGSSQGDDMCLICCARQ